MSSEFGLKDHHETHIVNFLRFSRSQRALSIRTIQAAYKDIEYARLRNETTLTVDEVHDILAELWESAKEEIDAELSHQSHTYVLLLRQLFLQADHWHLPMKADISELENKELLDRVRNFENEQFSGKKSNHTPRLEPFNDSGATVLLREKINSLEEENHRLREKVANLERRMIDLNENRSSKSSSDYAPKKSSRYSDEDVQQLEEKMNQLKTEMHKSKEFSSANEKSINEEMVSIKHRYLEIQEQLRMAEKELEKKFNQTNAYKNMKQMLDKKNEQIKDLRRRLNRYEPPPDD